MKIQHLLAISAFALLAACGQAAAPAAPAADAVDAAAAAPVELKVPAGVYALDPTHASLEWSITHLGLSHYTARFNTIDARLTLDPANLANSSVTATIDPKSVDAHYAGDYRGTHAQTGFGSWSEDIARNAAFLNADVHKDIRFASTKVEPTGPRTAEVTGDLTFLGQTKPVTLTVTFVGDVARHPMAGRPAIGFAAEGRFKRSDFGMSTGPLGDEATIRFNGEFIQQAPSAAPAQ
jgi:polyisoprenoid-binding protein YceI